MANIQEVQGKNGVKYRVLIRLKGCAPQSATFARKTDAKRWAQDTESAIRNGRHFKTVESKKHTVADMIDKYIKDSLPGKKSAADTTQRLLYWKAQIGVKSLADLNTPIIVGIRDKLNQEPYYTTRKTHDDVVSVERKRSPATVNRYLAALSHCITIAVKEWGWMEFNPMKNVSKLKEPQGRVRFLSNAERSDLLAACKESKNRMLYPVVVLALSTGMRTSEILELSWEDVDFDNQRIIIHDPKNGERRAAHIAGKALEILKEIKDKKSATELALEKKLKLSGKVTTDVDKITAQKKKLVFPASSALNTGPASIRTAWLYAMDRAGISNFRFHDTRHSAASELAMDGAALLDIAAVLGHKTLAMVKRYSHLSESHVGNVVASMNEKIFR